MTRHEQPNEIEVSAMPTRRDALRVGGGAALMAVFAAGLGGRAARAQEASPVAGDGLKDRYAIVRIRRLRAGQDVPAIMATIDADFAPLILSIPGYVSYFGCANGETGDTFYVGVFADKAGADESTRRAADWLTSNAYDWFEGDPIVVEGAIVVEAEVGAPSD